MVRKKKAGYTESSVTLDKLLEATLYIENRKGESPEQWEAEGYHFSNILKTVWKALPEEHKKAFMKHLREYGPQATIAKELKEETGIEYKVSEELYFTVCVGEVKSPVSNRVLIKRGGPAAGVSHFVEMHFQKECLYNGISVPLQPTLLHTVLHEFLHIVYYGVFGFNSEIREREGSEKSHAWIESEWPPIMESMGFKYVAED